MKSHGLLVVFVSFACIILLSSCAPNGYTVEKHGFISGLWHGFIIIFSLIGKLFGMDVGVYAENNSGFFYWLGFIIGIGALGLGGGGAAAGRRRSA